MAAAMLQKKAITEVASTSRGMKVTAWSCFLGGRWARFFSHLAATPSYSSSSLIPSVPAELHPQVPRPFPFGGSMELMAVPKKKVTPYKKGLRNGPKALKPVQVIVRCKSCGRVKLPHFYCCSGNRGSGGGSATN